MTGLVKLVRSASTLALMLLALDACSDSSPVAVASSRPCGSAGVVTLNALQAVTIDCSAGSVIQLAGAGARYLIVPEFATGNVTNRATSYVLSDSDALPAPASEILAKRVPNPSASFAGRLGSRKGPGVRQVRYTLRFSAPGGGAITSSLHPQVSIFRVQ